VFKFDLTRADLCTWHKNRDPLYFYLYNIVAV